MIPGIPVWFKMATNLFIYIKFLSYCLLNPLASTHIPQKNQEKEYL